MVFNYISFGYIPTGCFWRDLMDRCIGARNLIKRLQARTILSLVAPKAGDRILDFGCGSGFFAFEFSKRGAHAVGYDIIELPNKVRAEEGKIEFVKAGRGDPIPFPENYFHKILLSEVLVYLLDPKSIMSELCKRLKTGGQIIVVNTLGRKQIERAYQKNAILIRLLKKYYPHCPPTYQNFCSLFFRKERLNRNRWYTPEEIQTLLREVGFVNIRTLFPFKELPFLILYWIQFWKLFAQGTFNLNFGIVRYLILEMVKALGRRHDSSSVVIIGEKS